AAVIGRHGAVRYDRRSRSSGLPFAPRASRPGERERSRMPAPDELPLTGDALLEAVNDAMIALHERYYHRAPISARTQLLDDEILACVMGGVYTEVEKTLIELEYNVSVKDTRNAFQNAMRDKFIVEVERLSGRRVQTFISDSHVGPDLQIELFILGPDPRPAGTADGAPSLS